MESKDVHNKRSADLSERVSQYQFGTNGYFGPQLKNLSNALKTFGQQLELSSESLKNAAPSELEFLMHPGETKKIQQVLVFRIFDEKNKSLSRSLPRINMGGTSPTRNCNGSFCNNIGRC